MAQSQDLITRGNNGPILAALGAVGVALAGLALRRPTPLSRRQQADGPADLAAYLRDHLAGADAAIQIVQRLSDGYQGSPEGPLFESLNEQFREDRAVVEEMLPDRGASHRSIKRLAGRAAGNALKVVAGGESGDLSLFRTLEALAIGVQGKRCLWRAVQRLESRLHAPGRRSFVELEAGAVRQWEEIERCRLALVLRTFVG